MACIDLNKELAANDLSLTFEDVQQIICILYCVGTVDISPQKVASLRLIAQVYLDFHFRYSDHVILKL